MELKLWEWKGKPDFEVLRKVYNLLQILQNIVLMSQADSHDLQYNHIKPKGEVVCRSSLDEKCNYVWCHKPP